MRMRMVDYLMDQIYEAGVHHIFFFFYRDLCF